MSRFFINRPIVAMVISILMTFIGLIVMIDLPIAQFPNIVPPQIQVTTTYVGADSLTVEQSVATPIEQQMSGVDNMTYMYSINGNNGVMSLNVDFDVTTDPDTDQILAQMRQSQAQSQLPAAVNAFGVTVQKSLSAPLMLVALFSPDGSRDANFLANYAFINLNDKMTRTPGVASITIFGSGQYAMRFWVNPDQLAKLDVTVSEIVQAIQVQNNVNPAGQIGGEPVPAGQNFTYTVTTQGRLVTKEQFENIIIRANQDGSQILLGQVARVDLGSQVYNIVGRFGNTELTKKFGKSVPSAILAVYQLPDTNAIVAANGIKALMEKAKETFPSGIAYDVALDTTLAVTAGIDEIIKTLAEALILVVIVVFVFLQGWRATLIPLMAVPVSLVGTFILFPVIGFSINTLSLFGLVLAIGLVVDDAIVVVEAVEHHIEEGMEPKAAALKAMEEVSGPVVAIALILAAVFIPTAFIPGITGRLYQQFAVTIAISVIISAFNALTLSPALAAMLLRPKSKNKNILTKAADIFNRSFLAATDGYIKVCAFLIRRVAVGLILLLGLILGAGYVMEKMPVGFLPNEDQGYFYLNVGLPAAASLQRTSAVCAQVEQLLSKEPGIQSYTTVVGFSLLSGVQNTYSGFFFVTLRPWGDRMTRAEQIGAIAKRVAGALATNVDSAIAFPFDPPAIPGIGAAGGLTAILEDRGGHDVTFLANNTNTFLEALKKRPEISFASTTALLQIPQRYAKVDIEKAMKQGVKLSDIYQTLQAFMGGAFINYFNAFGRQWQTYIEAEGSYRTQEQNVGEFYVRGAKGVSVPMSTLIEMQPKIGPEFTMRYNLYRSTQINANAAPGYSSTDAMNACQDVFNQLELANAGMGLDYMGMSFQEQQAAKGVSPAVIFGISLLFVFLILAAQYESWALPFSVLLGTPIAVFGAFFFLWLRSGPDAPYIQNNVYAQIGLVMLIGLAAKNAILIVEFAKDELEKGKGIAEAALSGARLRLRPILMTAFAFILGCMPLWFATGSGAASRRVLGTTVVGGMLTATCIAIFVIPLCFYIVERLRGGKPGHIGDRSAPAKKPETTVATTPPAEPLPPKA